MSNESSETVPPEPGSGLQDAGGAIEASGSGVMTDGGQLVRELGEQREKIWAKQEEIIDSMGIQRSGLEDQELVEEVPGYEEVEEIDDALEELEEGMEIILQDYREFMEGYAEGGRLYEEFFESQISGLEELRQEYREMETLLEEQFEMVDELVSDYQDLKTDHEQLRTTHMARLEDLQRRQKLSGAGRAITGLFLLGLGYVSAETYYPFAGVAEFYLNAPGIYANNPGLMIPTLAFPVAGLYLFKAANDMRHEYLDTAEEVNRREREMGR